jgi:hypothetical protein
MALTAAVLPLQPQADPRYPVSISSALVRLSAVRDDYPIEEPQMQFVLRSVGVTWELARRLGPYLMLEILVPGGTLLALLLFLYRRRQLDGATGARRNALANWVSGSLRVLTRDPVHSVGAALSLTEISGTR